jgi:hypothetical protein
VWLQEQYDEVISENVCVIIVENSASASCKHCVNLLRGPIETTCDGGCNRNQWEDNNCHFTVQAFYNAWL